MSDTMTCKLCGEPMPAGEEMFFYHGYSGPCPNPPITPPAAQGGPVMFTLRYTPTGKLCTWVMAADPQHIVTLCYLHNNNTDDNPYEVVPLYAAPVRVTEAMVGEAWDATRGEYQTRWASMTTTYRAEILAFAARIATPSAPVRRFHPEHTRAMSEMEFSHETSVGACDSAAPVRVTEADALAGAFRQGAEWTGLAYLPTGPDGFYAAIEEQVRRRYPAASKGVGE